MIYLNLLYLYHNQKQKTLTDMKNLAQEFNYTVTDITTRQTGYGHWLVILEILNHETNGFYTISKTTTNSIAIDNDDRLTLTKEVLNYHYDDYADVDLSDI